MLVIQFKDTFAVYMDADNLRLSFALNPAQEQDKLSTPAERIVSHLSKLTVRVVWQTLFQPYL